MVNQHTTERRADWDVSEGFNLHNRAAVVSMQDRRDGKSIVFVVRQAHIPLRHACA